jgi:hypothetical protein
MFMVSNVATGGLLFQPAAGVTANKVKRTGVILLSGEISSQCALHVSWREYE